jgi:hypothetical protein
MKRSKFFKANAFYQLSIFVKQCETLSKELRRDIFEESSAAFKLKEPNLGTVLFNVRH